MTKVTAAQCQWREEGGGEDAAALHHYRGLFWRRPYLTAVLTVAMLSMAGIPFTAGFIGKFYIIAGDEAFPRELNPMGLDRFEGPPVQAAGWIHFIDFDDLEGLFRFEGDGGAGLHGANSVY